MSGKYFRAFTTALISGAVGLFIDLSTKSLFFDGAQREGSVFSIFNGVIRSTLHRNQGISFNLPVPFWITLLITGLALGWALALLIERGRKGAIFSCLILGSFIGGVLGNVYDRIAFGFVRDWILLFNMSAINLADLLIAGSILAWFASSRKTSTTNGA
jgi:signal peptidase II